MKLKAILDQLAAEVEPMKYTMKVDIMVNLYDTAAGKLLLHMVETEPDMTATDLQELLQNALFWLRLLSVLKTNEDAQAPKQIELDLQEQPC